MTEEKWEGKKMKEKYKPFSIYELLIFLLGVEIFSFSFLDKYKLSFIIFIIILYWIQIRWQETQIHNKEQEIYNVYYDTIKPIPQGIIDKQTEKKREPMYYELKQLQNKRKFLIDKFIVVNLILVILIQLFIK